MVADIGLSVLGISGVVITAIIKQPWVKNNGSAVSEKFCNERHKNIDASLSEIKKDVKKLLSRGG